MHSDLIPYFGLCMRAIDLIIRIKVNLCSWCALLALSFREGFRLLDVMTINCDVLCHVAVGCATPQLHVCDRGH